MQGLLCEFVENDLSPAQVRKQYRHNLSSTNRTWRVRADAKHHGAYAQPISWNMTTQDIVFAGHGSYLDSVRTWAKSILQDLRASGNIRPN